MKKGVGVGEFVPFPKVGVSATGKQAEVNNEHPTVTWFLLQNQSGSFLIRPPCLGRHFVIVSTDMNAPNHDEVEHLGGMKAILENFKIKLDQCRGQC